MRLRNTAVYAGKVPYPEWVIRLVRCKPSWKLPAGTLCYMYVLTLTPLALVCRDFYLRILRLYRKGTAYFSGYVYPVCSYDVYFLIPLFTMY